MSTSHLDEPKGDWVFFVDGQHQPIEIKTVKNVLHLDGLQGITWVSNSAGMSHWVHRLLKEWGETLGVREFSKTGTLQSLVKDVRAILKALAKKGIVKTEAARYYLELVVMRPLLRMRALLRQKLASAAPAAGLTLRNRPRQIFASHPPVAPPDQA